MRIISTLFSVTAILFLSIASINNAYAQPCSNAGTAAATSDSICSGGKSNLTLTGYIGAIQWQSYDGSIWNDEVVVGSTTDNYEVTPGATTDYRAVVTDTGCDPDTSNIVTITVGLNAPSATGATRCGYGPVTVNATGSGIKWYDASTGGNLLSSGNSYTTTINSTTTFYAAASLGGGPPSPFTTTFNSNNGFDGNMFDITAINTVTIDSFAANFNVGSGTAEIWYRPGTHVGFTNSNAGWTLAGTAPYTSVATGAPGTSINVYVNVTIPAGQTYAFYVHGSAGIQYTNGTGVGNIYSSDANIEFKEGYGGAYFNLVNFPRIFNGRIMYSAGCESARTAVQATVNPSTSFTLQASPPALCQGQSSTITASSTNSGYNYTWSPATGLSSTSGASVTATPLSPITYTVIADDGTCGYIDSIFVSVGPASVAGSAAISTDTICLGTDASLFLTGYTGNIQWQSFDGTNWTNETNPGSTSDVYQISPTTFTQYRALVTSGGCDTDTSNVLSIEVIAIMDPVTVNDTICGPGIVNLTGSGPGVLNWFTAPTGGTSINTGSTYSPNISGNTTYYVEASAGGTYNVGPPDQSIGSQFTVSGTNWGLQFDVIQQISLDKVYIAPGGASGNVIINLRASQGGPILQTKTVSVTAFTGLQPVTLGWIINPGTGYRLETGAGSVLLYYNSFGASYPYTFPGSSVSITGFVNPNPGSTNFYYFFYNWEITEGCKSNRVPVEGIVLTPPAIPMISQNGTLLTSSSSTNNQWYNNGIAIPGANGQTYNLNLSGSGSYTVIVTDPLTGCTSESLPIIYTGINDPETSLGINLYPNPVNEFMIVEITKPLSDQLNLKIYNLIGEVVATKTISDNKTTIMFDEYKSGSYYLEFEYKGRFYREKIMHLK